jgi:glycosyltransferase involved in cell wall biosynthesis
VKNQLQAVQAVKASVIIPTYNRMDILARVMRCYCCQNISKQSFELIIVDDGSSDETGSLFEGLKNEKIEGSLPHPLIKPYRKRINVFRKGWYAAEAEAEAAEDLFFQSEPIYVSYVMIEKSGRSVARNIGLALSAYPLVIFADDDIFVEPEFVRKHIQAHSEDDNLVVSGRVIHFRDLENPFSAKWKLKDINTSFLATGNASVLKRHIMASGMFDENYTVYGWEDFDLGVHLKENGLISRKRGIYGYHYDPPKQHMEPGKVYAKEKERGITAVYFYLHHPLPWVRRFTLVHNRFLQSLFQVLGRGNWFLKKERTTFLKGVVLLIVRYKGYFDGIKEGQRQYRHDVPENKGDERHISGTPD